MATIITITNRKGGVGKSTTVVNLAASLAAAGKKVLVVDMDVQGNSTMLFGCRESAIDGNEHITRAIEESLPLDQVRMQTNTDDVHILASHPSLTNVRDKYAGYKRQYELLRATLNDAVTGEYDFVLIDTNPTLDCLLASALDVSHYYLIPLFAEVDSAVGLVELRKWLDQVITDTRREIPLLGVLVTNYDKDNATHRNMAEFLRQSVSEGTRIFETRIPRSNSVQAAAQAGVPLIRFRNGGSPASLAYVQLAVEILNITQSAQAAEAPAQIAGEAGK